EYAMEAIGNAGAAIGILARDGVILVGEKKVTSKLLQTSRSTEKMYKIDDHLACAVAGIMSDANILINTARVQAQRYTFAYQEPMPIEQLVQSLCDTKQGYTQFGGLRPFGVSFLFAGWDKNYGFQLYMSDPSVTGEVAGEAWGDSSSHRVHLRLGSPKALMRWLFGLTVPTLNSVWLGFRNRV
ncbi:hypothetical protein GW17_00055385, partial [Ensete ventricosum]